MLKAKKPELIKTKKPVFLLSGRSGVGKTVFALSFPAPYLIDHEGGATREQYRKKLISSKGAYLGKDQGSQDFKVIIEEIKNLATQKHQYRTLILDSFTHLYLLEAARAEEKIGNDFGRDKKEANKPTRQMMRWLEKLDMTVIIICHAKDKWVRQGKEVVCEGTTFDGYDKLEYMLDLWIEIKKTGVDRFFTIKKSRINGFIESESFPLSYDKFVELYGKDIVEGESKPIILASPEQVQKIKDLIELVKIPDDTIGKWMKKFDVNNFEDMSKEDIDKCINFVEKKLETIKKGE